ncbi:MAG: hypothetical protein V2I46_01065 [Bacteroides sp.]|jgi:hypothetical protein|nr:hypothetical protein [Bacteroides sp.]
MKRIIFLFAFLSIFSGCKKEGGKLGCTMTYELSNPLNAELKTYSDDLTSDQYSQFGDYITSITPSRFVGKFLHLRFTNWHEDQYPGDEFNIDLFENHSEIANPQRLADFSNGSTVSFVPEEVNVRKTTDLIYFLVIPIFFYQELELPEQYENFYGNMLQFLNFDGTGVGSFDGFSIGAEKIGRFVKAGYQDFVAPIFIPNWTGSNGNYGNLTFCYAFGNTDSTFVFHNDIPDIRTNDNPLGQTGYIIRSHQHNPITITSIPEGEIRSIQATMSFNTIDLIQIYAGQDNIPYTSDDIFVYSPKFWERMAVTLVYN